MSQSPLSPPQSGLAVIPPPPRAVTRVALRRSWAEMPVRVWCVLAIALVAVIVYFTIGRVAAGASERALILNGIPVDAVAVQISGTMNPEARFTRSEVLTGKVRYTLPGETEPRTVPGSLSIVATPGAVIHPGDHIALRVDPSDPNNWTDRTEPRSWVVELSVVAILLPLVLLLLLVAFLQRARVLRIWRHGEETAATVVEIRQTALAPLSRLVRFTVNDGSSSRVCSVLVPVRAGVPGRGDAVTLVMPRGVPQRAVMAKLYVSCNPTTTP